MKKFAVKLSLESTQYPTLRDLVAEAIKFALDSPRTTTGKSTDAECLAEATRIAEVFCDLQDELSKAEKK
jgi:hypothetical protein